MVTNYIDCLSNNQYISLSKYYKFGIFPKFQCSILTVENGRYICEKRIPFRLSNDKTKFNVEIGAESFNFFVTPKALKELNLLGMPIIYRISSPQPLSEEPVFNMMKGDQGDRGR